ncbi:MAG: hypothetical protein WCE48_05770 [Steroidobacteraceae bacterium]
MKWVPDFQRPASSCGDGFVCATCWGDAATGCSVAAAAGSGAGSAGGAAAADAVAAGGTDAAIDWPTVVVVEVPCEQAAKLNPSNRATAQERIIGGLS